MIEDAPREMWGFSGLMGAYAILGNRIGGKPATPPMWIPKRKSMWFYLSSREHYAVASEAIESGETMSEWIRNAVRKAAKC